MKIWQKFKFGIFDCDGTLFDNMALCADAFDEVTMKFSLPQKEVRKIYLETNGMNLNDQFKLILDKYRIKYDKILIDKLNKEFFALRDNWKKWQNAPLFPNTGSALKTLHENRIKIFMSSGSNTDEVAFRLKKAKIFKYFSLIMGAEKTPKSQKHFDIFANFCKIPPQNFASEAFSVSDGPNDMTLAKNAGIFAIGITNTVDDAKLISGGANIVIAGMNELKNLEF